MQGHFVGKTSILPSEVYCMDSKILNVLSHDTKYRLMHMKVDSPNPTSLQHPHYQYLAINSQLMRSVGGVILLIHSPHGLHHCRSGEGYRGRARHLKHAQ
jgi:hypothetical protein